MSQSNSAMPTMSALEARRHWGDLFDRVARSETRVIVEQDGVPVAALVSAEYLGRLTALDADRAAAIMAFATFGERFKDVPDEEIEREVSAALAEVRAENPRSEQMRASARST